MATGHQHGVNFPLMRSWGTQVVRLASRSNQSFDTPSREAMPDMRSSARWMAFMSYLPQSGNACGSRPSATQVRNVASSRPISAAACASLTSRGVDGTGRRLCNGVDCDVRPDAVRILLAVMLYGPTIRPLKNRRDGKLPHI